MSLLAITVLQLVELSGTIYVIMAVDHYLAVRPQELVDIGVREGRGEYKAVSCLLIIGKQVIKPMLGILWKNRLMTFFANCKCEKSLYGTPLC